MTDRRLEGSAAQRLAQGPVEPENALDIREQKIIFAPDGKPTLVGFPGRDPGAEPMARFAKGAAKPG